METTTLQVPLTKNLKSSATSVVKEYGFSSLQEVVRIFLTKLAQRELSLEITSVPIFLSHKAENRYLKMDKDFKKRGNINCVSGLDDLMDQLTS